MSRAANIAGVAVASLILVGGSIVSVAAISASVSAEPFAPAVVVQDAIVPAPAAPALGDADLQVASSDDDLIVPDVSVTTDSSDDAAESADSESDSTSGATTTSAVSRSITTAAARHAVVDATHGRVIAMGHSTRGGYSAYAVKVKRADGSVVIGYVDRKTGVVYDWVKVSGATYADSDSSQGSSPSKDSEDSQGSYSDDSDDSSDDSYEGDSHSNQDSEDSDSYDEGSDD